MELDFDVIGDNAEVFPLTFSDAEVGALEDEFVFKAREASTAPLAA